MKKIKIIFAEILLILASTTPVYAQGRGPDLLQGDTNPPAAGGIRGFGPLGFGSGQSYSQASSLFESTLSKILGFLTIGAILWFILQLILGAYSWMTAGGDPKNAQAARNKITFAVIGLVIALTALVITSAIAYLLGVESVFNVSGLLNNQLKP